MGKRTDGLFERRERDFYASPEQPILKLLPHIMDISRFSEPMCGDGAIVKTLEGRGWECLAAWDMEPQGDMIMRAGRYNVMWLEDEDFNGIEEVISNPPWPLPAKLRTQIDSSLPDGWPTVPIIQHLMAILPTWMLLSADFMHNAYFRALEPHCVKIVSVGRVKWIAGSDNTGKDNAAWYKFDINHTDGPKFIGNHTARDLYHPDLGDDT